MKYVESFLMPVPVKNLAAYRKMARRGAKIWKEHGSLDYKESVAADTSAFPGSVKTKRGELIVLSWIVYKSRKHCETVTARVMKDKRLGAMLDPKSFPFDPKRMIRGYFEVLAES